MGIGAFFKGVAGFLSKEYERERQQEMSDAEYERKLMLAQKLEDAEREKMVSTWKDDPISGKRVGYNALGKPITEIAAPELIQQYKDTTETKAAELRRAKADAAKAERANSPEELAKLDEDRNLERQARQAQIAASNANVNQSNEATKLAREREERLAKQGGDDGRDLTLVANDVLRDFERRAGDAQYESVAEWLEEEGTDEDKADYEAAIKIRRQALGSQGTAPTSAPPAPEAPVTGGPEGSSKDNPKIVTSPVDLAGAPKGTWIKLPDGSIRQK